MNKFILLGANRKKNHSNRKKNAYMINIFFLKSELISIYLRNELILFFLKNSQLQIQCSEPYYL